MNVELDVVRGLLCCEPVKMNDTGYNCDISRESESGRHSLTRQQCTTATSLVALLRPPLMC